MNFKIITRTLQSILLLLALYTPNSFAIEKKFQFDDTSGKTVVDILNLLKSDGYNKIPVDDRYAGLLLDAYLSALDPGRVIFITADIEEFKKHQKQFDNEISQGNLVTVSDIYNRFEQRNKALLEHTLEDVNRYTEPYSGADAFVELDRKAANWPANINESISLWDKRVFNDALNLKLSGKSPQSIPDLLHKRYEERLRRLETLGNDDVFEAFINALTSLYDPHTEWMSPKADENFKISMSLSLQGIGAVLQMDEEKTKIVSLVTGGPAAKSGEVTPGDYIVGVGQDKQGDIQDVIGWRLDEVVQKVRGAKGSYVRLQIEDAVTKKIKIVTIQRDQVKLEDQAAKSTIIEIPPASLRAKSKKIGIINVPAFYMNFDAYREGDVNFRSTTKDVMKLLEDLDAKHVDGIVLDLRNNGGGSLKESATFTNLFIDPGPVVQIRSSNNQISREFRAQNPSFYKKPLLVLINHLSASATEIFAGAIQDYHRALIVGEQSFGKGTVQSISDLDYGELKLTTAKFYRVSGDSTQHRGVVPDITFPSLFDFKLVGESALDNPLPWDNIHGISHFQYDDPNVYRDDLEKKHIDRMNKSPDYQALMKKIDFMQQKKEDKTISLNESIRVAERQKDDKIILEITNSVRSKKGQKPFKSIEELEKDATDHAALSTSKTVIDTENDFLLRESAQILADFVDLQAKSSPQKPVTANNK